MKNMTYDQTVDAAYLKMEDKSVVDSEEIADGIIVDYDQQNNIVGVELLGVKTLTFEHLNVLNSMLPELSLRQLQDFIQGIAIVS